MVEYGDIVANDANLTMPSKGNPFPTQYMYNITSVPQTNLDNRTSSVPASNIVGGGSAINAMFFDRGAKADYDAWAQLGNTGWGWSDLLPYFKKVGNVEKSNWCGWDADGYCRLSTLLRLRKRYKKSST